MKNIKIYLSIFIAVALFKTASAQDIQLNMLTLPPGTVEVGDTTYIQVDVQNVDASNITAPRYKIRPLISTSGVVTIIKATSDTLGTPVLASQWLQLSLSAGPGNSIRLEYQDTIANSDTRTFYVQIVAVAVGTGNFTGTLQWGNGTSPGGPSGPQTAGNIPANDNTTTGIIVSAPLPVSLTAFTAVKQGNTSLLNWNTAAEVNNDGFDIERSADGRRFSKIGMVYSKAENGNSHESLDYTYTDATPLTGTNYYRLRQVDRDGKSVYSHIEQVTFGAASGVSIYPNPATHTVHVEAPEGSKVSVYNIIGQRVTVPATGSGRLVTLDVSALAAGNYTVQVLDNASGISSHKLAVVK